LTIFIIAIPAIAFIVFIIYKPEALLVDNVFYRKNKRFLTIEDRTNISRKEKQQQIDDILEKIHKKGMHSLTKKERLLLEEYATKV